MWFFIFNLVTFCILKESLTVMRHIDNYVNPTTAPNVTALDWSSEWDDNGVIQYIIGQDNLLISVPHGGYAKPDWISDRRQLGCNYHTNICYWNESCPDSPCRALLWGDPNTIDIATWVYKTLEESGIRPHMVVNHMARIKMDPNRGGPQLSEGIQNDPKAEEVYNAYHNFIVKAKDRIGNLGLLIDIHGQHHKENWTEIGYLWTASQLNEDYLNASESSLKSLFHRLKLCTTPEEVIRGKDSLGSIIASYGYRAVPSTWIPKPGRGGYYRGGFITQQHGSLKSSPEECFDALQIEVTQNILYATPARRHRFAQDLATSLQFFTRQYYTKTTDNCETNL